MFQKLYVCLFEKVLLLTRPITRDGAMLYQVYSDPLLLYDLVVEDLGDSCVQSGSFKRVFTPTQSGLLCSLLYIYIYIYIYTTFTIFCKFTIYVT